MTFMPKQVEVYDYMQNFEKELGKDYHPKVPNSTKLSSSSNALYSTANSALSAADNEYFNKVTAWNASEAQKNRDFEAFMSNTAYRRAVADMRLAGLNPALMFNSATSASSPSGSVASYSGGYTSAFSERLAIEQLAVARQQAKASEKNADANVRNSETNRLKAYLGLISSAYSAGLNAR